MPTLYPLIQFFCIVAGCLIAVPSSTFAQQSTESFWPTVTETTRPWTRWWWMGNAVDATNLKHQLEQYAEAGLGGVEITPIYGAKGYESKYLDYLSPEWMEALRYTIRIANSLGLGVDMNLGTGWPFGGPQVTPEAAASQLVVQTYELAPGQVVPSIAVDDSVQRALGASLIALTAYQGNHEPLLLTDSVAADGLLRWTPTGGPWKLYALFAGKTRQQVKRATPGGEGYTLDHLSSKALPVYLQRFDEAFGKNPPAIRSYFNDSYEVYNADFSPQLPTVFQQQRGYDLRPYVQELLTEEDSDTARRVKADYYETMSYLLLHNFTQPWSKWIHQHGALSRNQAHGSPGNLLDLYAAVDIPESETFGTTQFSIPGLNNYTHDTRNVEPDPVMMKFATSASHVLGKPLASSETFTWLGEHFKVPLARTKPEVEQVFLAGVNHVFYHGTTYAPQEAEWPGWLFYASVNFAPSNSWWPHLKGLNEYIARCQSVLQAGTADSDALIYWPIHDLWYNAPRDRLDQQLSIHSIEEWLHPTDFYQTTEALMKSGYLVDFVSDALLDSLQVNQDILQASDSATRYRTLIVPTTTMMPVATFEQILHLAEAGGTVIFQALPQDVPGLHQLSARRQQLDSLKGLLTWEDQGEGNQRASRGNGAIWITSDVPGTLERVGVKGERLVDTGLKFTRRRRGNDHYYYLVNHAASRIDTLIPLNSNASGVMIADPQDGRQGWVASVAQDTITEVRVAIEPGEALILQTTSEKPANVTEWAYLVPEGEAIALDDDWELTFTQGGPVTPDSQSLSQLISWTELPDTNAVRYSGTATYQTTFTLADKSADDYLLQLGDVRESARVWVNDQEVSICWSIPFQIKIGSYLKPGKNTLTIEVANLMANRIRDMDRRGIAWRNYHEINFVRLDYEPFDAAHWEPQPSGLLGPVQILPLTESR